VQAGDVLVGLASSGLHSNGYSLARKVLLEEQGRTLDEVADALLEPTRIYARAVRALSATLDVRGMAHITGGGLVGNVPRIFPKGLACTIDTRSWPCPPIFKYLQSLGVPRQEMFRVFNMGIGYVLVVRAAFRDSIIGHFRRKGIDAVAIGKMRKGDDGVELKS
jgi:phosphoribosylformylglycinamidine cyclo-ligase